MLLQKYPALIEINIAPTMNLFIKAGLAKKKYIKISKVLSGN